MAVLTLHYAVDVNGIEPNHTQLAGIQGEHNVTSVEFNATNLIDKIGDGYENLCYHFEGRNAAGAKKSTRPQPVGENKTFTYSLENWLTKDGGLVTVQLVFSALDEENKTTLELYTFYAKLQLTAKLGYADDDDYEGVVTMYQVALQSASSAFDSKESAEEAERKANEFMGNAQSARDEAVRAKGAAEAAESNAKASQDAAESAREEAKDYAANAATSATDADNAANRASGIKEDLVSLYDEVDSLATEASENADRAESARQGIDEALASAEEFANQAGTYDSKYQEYLLKTSTAKDKAEAAKGAAEAAQSKAETAKQGAEKAKGAAEKARDDAQNAQLAAETAESNAKASQDAAESARKVAKDYAASADQSVTDADNAANRAKDLYNEVDSLATQASENADRAEAAAKTVEGTVEKVEEMANIIFTDELAEENIKDKFTIIPAKFYGKDNEIHDSPEVMACTTLIRVNEGDSFKITATYGYFTVLVAQFNENYEKAGYEGEWPEDKAVEDYLYTVPGGVSYIAVSNRDQKYNELVIKKVYNKTLADDVAKNTKDIAELNEEIAYAENGIEKDSIGVIGGTLSVDNNTLGVTASKEREFVRITTKFGKYNNGDKVLFMAKIKTPFGVGGSVEQNKVFVNIYNNFTTGMIYAVDGVIVPNTDWNDYYGIIEFDGDYSAHHPTYFSVDFNSADRIPDNAVIEFKNLMAINLTKAFGAGNEPTAEEFYSLLNGFENEYIDGKVKLFGTDANIRRIYKNFKNTLTEDITVTVGEGGDFATINTALEYLSAFYPAYKKGGINCYIKILAGTVINEQIYANQIDLQYITIIAEAGNTETIIIDDTTYTMVIVDVDATGFNHTANAHDARGNYPFIAGENAAKLPTIGCVFRLLPNTVESGKKICGMLCNRGSEGVVLAASGFDGFNDGVIANNESSITIREGISRNMTNWGVHARHNGEVSARSCVCTDCGVGACADRVADCDVREAVLDRSAVAIECNNLSRVNANGCHAKECGTEKGCVVTISGGGFVNCGDFDTDGYKGDLYNVTPNEMSAKGIVFI